MSPPFAVVVSRATVLLPEESVEPASLSVQRVRYGSHDFACFLTDAGVAGLGERRIAVAAACLGLHPHRQRSSDLAVLYAQGRLRATYHPQIRVRRRRSQGHIQRLSRKVRASDDRAGAANLRSCFLSPRFAFHAEERRRRTSVVQVPLVGVRLMMACPPA
eukprot:scaffold2069_cov254-Pinguiococcus_pyrenoidosus.AAC.14